MRVLEADAGEHLAAVGADPVQGLGGVPREAVVDLVDEARQSAAVHGAEDELALERPEQQQVVQHVRGGEHAVHLGVRQGDLQPVEQAAPVGHGVGLAAHPQGAAGRVVGGDDEVLPPVHGSGVTTAGVRGALDGARVLQPDPGQVLVAAGVRRVELEGGGRGHRVAPSGTARPRSRSSWKTSAGVGMASEQEIFEATIAPEALA